MAARALAGGDAVACMGVDLGPCDLTDASFFNADLTGAILHDTNLTGANFFDAITAADFDNTTCPEGVNSDANGDTCCGAFILAQTPTGCAPP